jgi:hypothetical protein
LEPASRDSCFPVSSSEIGEPPLFLPTHIATLCSNPFLLWATSRVRWDEVNQSWSVPKVLATSLVNLVYSPVDCFLFTLVLRNVERVLAVDCLWQWFESGASKYSETPNLCYSEEMSMYHQRLDWRFSEALAPVKNITVTFTNVNVTGTASPSDIRVSP